MAQRYADDKAKIDGAIFPLKDRHGKQPEYTGVIEFTSAMLKSMVDEAKAGNIPVRVRLAVWPHQVSERTGNAYRFAKMEVLYPKDNSVPVPEPTPSDSEDDEMPWD